MPIIFNVNKKTMKALQFVSITQNLLRISFVSRIEQRRLQISMRKALNFRQTVQQTNVRTYTSKVKDYYGKFNYSLSASKDSDTNDDAVISTFDLFSIGIGPSSRFVTVTL